MDSLRPIIDSLHPIDDSLRPIDDSHRPIDDSLRPIDDSLRPTDRFTFALYKTFTNYTHTSLFNYSTREISEQRGTSSCLSKERVVKFTTHSMVSLSPAAAHTHVKAKA